MPRLISSALLLLMLIQIPGLAQQSLKVAFITRNAYGNNLYFDNLTAGHRYPSDLALMPILNVAADTSYLIGNVPLMVAPRVSITNLGTQALSTPCTVTCIASPIGYHSTRSVSSLAPGAALELTMDVMTIPPSTPLAISAFSDLESDMNRSNDTVRQTSLFLPGVKRNVLLEQWTSSTCSPCAANNPTIDAFIASHSDSIVAVKYHVGWPLPGDDPMYLYNPTQSYDRRYYYGVSTVPHVIMDGTVTPQYPYTLPASLSDAFGSRSPVGTPVSLAVSDSLIAGDSIQATVTVTILSPLREGLYRLRVQAVEKHIVYDEAPGSNGETHFHDVFRGSYPGSAGTVITTDPGTSTFYFRYRQAGPALRDSLYSIAFVQDDATREVLNAARSARGFHTVPLPFTAASPADPREQCMTEKTGPAANPPPPMVGIESVGLNYELFEGAFPAPGWRLANPDGGLTMEKSTAANGPSFGGTACVKMDFYDYGSTDQTDTLFSAAILDLLPADTLRFDWAYAQYNSSYNDRLIVKVSTNGGMTYDSTIFDRTGASLATAPATTSPFVPTGSQWATFSRPLAGLIPPIPNPPALHQPADGASSVPLSPVCRWHASTTASSYRLEVSQDPLFGTTVFAAGGLTDTTAVPSGLVPATSYYWRVRATNNYGNSPWSSTYRFTTIQSILATWQVHGSWNLVSLPVLVNDPRTQWVFPGATSAAYGFDAATGYVRTDTLEGGIGYWLKFPDSGMVSVAGYPKARDTIAISLGWNLIGSITTPVAAGAVVQIPPGILHPVIYGYGTSYTPADTLHPGQAYWVKASAPGRIVLSDGLRKK